METDRTVDSSAKASSLPGAGNHLMILGAQNRRTLERPSRPLSAMPDLSCRFQERTYPVHSSADVRNLKEFIPLADIKQCSLPALDSAGENGE